LQALKIKVRDLKLLCPSQLRGLKDRKIKIVKSMFYMKNKKTANFDKLLLTVGLLKELQLLNDSKH
jgi:hypothetical protein